MNHRCERGVGGSPQPAKTVGFWLFEGRQVAGWGGSKFGFWLFQPRQVAGRNLAFGFFEPRNHIKYPIFHHFYPIFPIFLLYFSYFHINIPYIWLLYRKIWLFWLFNFWNPQPTHHDPPPNPPPIWLFGIGWWRVGGGSIWLLAFWDPENPKYFHTCDLESGLVLSLQNNRPLNHTDSAPSPFGLAGWHQQQSV